MVRQRPSAIFLCVNNFNHRTVHPLVDEEPRKAFTRRGANRFFEGPECRRRGSPRTCRGTLQETCGEETPGCGEEGSPVRRPSDRDVLFRFPLWDGSVEEREKLNRCEWGTRVKLKKIFGWRFFVVSVPTPSRLPPDRGVGTVVVGCDPPDLARRLRREARMTDTGYHPLRKPPHWVRCVCTYKCVFWPQVLSVDGILCVSRD